ncbi:MAG TPA: phage tail tape measure protein [Dehalococcoidia bacterium]|nr:phage tail tape measure protein [Dehalococcoidia bacterium]
MSEGPIITGRLRLKDETGKTLDSLRGKIGSVFGIIAKSVMVAGAAAVTGMGLSIKAAADFEEALTRIIAASGKTGEEAKNLETALSDAAKAAGPEFGISATNAVVALEALVKAGLEGEEAITALQGALQLAALEGMGTAEASNMLVSAMTMFGLEAEDATHIIDMFSAAADAGIDAAGGYAAGLSNVGATANAMGLSMEETMAALVQLDKTFGGAQESGTFLNRMLLDMTSKADKAGLELYNVDGSMRSLDDIMGQVREVLQGFGDDQKAVNEWLGQFDMRAQKAILGLAGYDESIYETQRDLEQMRSAQDKVNLVLDTFAGRMKIAGSRIQVMAVSLGERLMPYALGVLTVFEDWMPVISDLIDDFATFATKIFDVAGALAEGDWDAAFRIIEEIYSGISSKFVEWFNEIDWDGVWAKARAFLGTLYERFMGWAGDIASFFIAWWGKIDWIAVWSGLQTFTEGLFDTIKGWAGDIATFFVDWWDATDWDEVWGGLKRYVTYLWDKVAGWAGDISTAFLNWFGTVNWSTVFGGLSDWMDAFWGWLFGKAVPDIETAFTEWVGTVDWSAVFKSLGSFAVNLPLWIFEQISKAPQNIGYYIGEHIRETDWREVFSAIGDGIVDTLKGAADTFLDWMPDWLKELLGLKKIEVPAQPKPPAPTPPAPTPPRDGDRDGAPTPPAPAPPVPTPPAPTPPTPYIPEGPWGGAERFAVQHGFEGMVTKPTHFLAGEAGSEYVSVTPRGALAERGSGDININVTVGSMESSEDARRYAVEFADEAVRELRKRGVTM